MGNGPCPSTYHSLHDLFVYDVLTERQVDECYIKAATFHMLHHTGTHTHSHIEKRSAAHIYSCAQKHNCFIHTWNYTRHTLQQHSVASSAKRVKSLKVQRLFAPFKAVRIADI